jgi:Protein of unknown function (DUF2510)
MTATSMPPDPHDREFQALLAEYSQLIYRDGILIQTLFAVVGVTATVLGALFFVLPDYDPHRHGLAGNPWIYLAVPLLPILLLGLLIFLTLHINFLAQYSHSVEKKIARITGAELSPGELGVPRAYAESPSFMRLASRLFGSGRGSTAKLYTGSVLVVFFGVGLLLVGVPAYVVRRLPAYVNLLNFVFYTPLVAVLLSALVRSLRPNRSLLRDTLIEYEPESSADTKDDTVRNQAPEKDPTLIAYLLSPRGADNIAKVAIGTIGILIGRSALVRESGAQYLSWTLLREIALFGLVFELLFYQARYTWNDVRDVDDDQQHAESLRRRRIPPPVTRERLIAVLVSIPARVVTGLFILFALASSERRPMILGLLAVLLCAFLYELLRDRERKGDISPIRAPRPLVYGIFSIIGCGYVIRIVVGVAIGSQGTIPLSVFVIIGFTMWLVELSTVAMTWIFEGSVYLSWEGSLGKPKESVYNPRLRKKAHIGYLLTQAGLLDEGSVEQDEPPRKENAKLELLRLDIPRRRLTVWSVGGAASFVAGSVTALSVANAFSVPSRTRVLVGALIALSASIAFFAPEPRAPKWLTRFSKEKVERLPLLLLAVLIASAGVGAFGKSQGMPLWWLGALLLGVVGLFYEITRRNSYDLVFNWLNPIKAFSKTAARSPALAFAWLIGPTAGRTLHRPRIPQPSADLGIVRWDTPRRAGWLPDPWRRHQLRYWDGGRWTDRVADGGKQGLDPM